MWTSIDHTNNVLLESQEDYYENIPMVIVLWFVYCLLGVLILSVLTTIYLSFTYKQDKLKLSNEMTYNDLGKQDLSLKV
ncbi:hypothetical protein MOUN0_O08768 [Monosporozyma unispora]